MIKVKALAVMTRPELEQAMGQMNKLDHDQRKLIELQQEQVRVLREALGGLLADVFEYQAMNNVGGWDNHAQAAARATLAATEPRP